MDFLRIISQYNTQRLSETLLSSFLNYFLSPQEDHGFGYTVLSRYFEKLGLIDADGIRDSRAFWSKRPDVGVFHEHDLGTELGRIDSLVRVTYGSDVWIVGTEVKIHDASAKNVSKGGQLQLSRYFGALHKLTTPDSPVLREIGCGDSDDLRRELLESVGCDESNKLKSVTLAYLVPTASMVWGKEAKAFWKQCGKWIGRSDWAEAAFRIVPWASAEQTRASFSQDDPVRMHITKESLADIVHSILEDQVHGRAPQCDLHALHLLRCIQYAASNDFKYDFAFRYGKFASQEEFWSTLDANGEAEVFDALSKASRAKRVSANPLHSTIGIPVTIPKERPDNSLLAIRTSASYDEPQTLDYVELEFSTAVYTREALQKAMDDFLKAQVGLFSADKLTLAEGVHPDSAGNQPVYLLPLRKGEGFTKEKAIEALCGFMDELRREFFNGYEVKG